jgi:hypothetical protein
MPTFTYRIPVILRHAPPPAERVDQPFDSNETLDCKKRMHDDSASADERLETKYIVFLSPPDPEPALSELYPEEDKDYIVIGAASKPVPPSVTSQNTMNRSSATASWLRYPNDVAHAHA